MPYQLQMFAPPVVALEPWIVLEGDPRWKSCLAELLTAPCYGLDIETWGSPAEDALDPWKGRIRLISVGLPSGLAIICDLGGILFPRPIPPDFLDALARAQGYAILHNGYFDLLFLRVAYPQLRFRKVRCTLLLSRVYWAGVGALPLRYCPKCRVVIDYESCSCGVPLQTTPKLEHSLQAVAERCGFLVDKTEQTSDWAGVLGNGQRNYAGNDCLLPVKIYHDLKPRMVAEGVWSSAIGECDALPVFVEMSFNGMPVDEATRQHVLALYKDAQETGIQPFREQFPSVNPGSPSQVLRALNSAGFFPDSTRDEALEEWKDEPAVKALLLWRSLGTQVAYLEGLTAPRARSKYNQIAPKGQGRSSSSDPNLQNSANIDEHPDWVALGLPSVRSVFVAPKGYKLIVLDFSQSFARIATQCSKDPLLIRAYRDGEDMHCVTGARIMKLRGKEWSKDDIARWRADETHENHLTAKLARQEGKKGFYTNLNLGGLAPELRQALREAFPALYAFQRGQITKATRARTRLSCSPVDHGEVRCPTGRRLWVPIRLTKYGPSVKGPDVVSFTWMGTEKDIACLALRWIQDEFDANPHWDAQLCNFPHDEPDALALEEHAEEVAIVMQACMDRAMATVVKVIPVSDGKDPRKGVVNSWAEK